MAIFVLLVSPIAVADPNPILGRWEDARPNGQRLIWEFTESTVSFVPVDAVNKPTSAPNKIETAYKRLGRTGDNWETFGIELKNPDGKPGHSMMAVLKDHKNMILDFPGMGAARLVRIAK